MAETFCGHTADNNRKALLGVQAVSLLFSVAFTIVCAIFAAFEAGAEEDRFHMSSLISYAVYALCGGVKVVGLCLGLAGISLSKTGK